MLRIPNSLSFRDPAGREYRTQSMILTLRDNVKLYTVADNDRYVFVHFPNGNYPSEGEIYAMCNSFSEQTAEANILWPKMVCFSTENDQFCGFLAKQLDFSGELTPLSRLMEPDILNSLSTEQRLSIGLNLAGCFHAVHRVPRGYLLGAPQPRDFHVSQDGRVFFLYAYRHDLDFYSQQNSLYLAPEYRAMQQKNLSTKSDAFSFAVMLFILLTGVFPFGAHDPGTEFSNGNIADMILNGESLYYYESSPQTVATEQMLTDISPELAGLFRKTFDYCGKIRYDENRPSIDEWIDALNGTLKK